MARMNKEQRSIVSKQICQKAIDRFTRLHGKQMKAVGLTLSLSHRWGNIEPYSINYSETGDTTCPAVKPVIKQLYAEKAYTIKLSPHNKLEISFTKIAQHKIDKALAPRKILIKAIKDFNAQMDNNFIMATSFTDLNDVSGFIAAFASKIK